VTAELSLLAEGYSPKNKVWTEIRYLENHGEAGHMKYHQFRKQGAPLGSGAIESAVRRVVNLRLKGNGMLWEVENAEAMLVLRAAALTDRWEEALEHSRQTLAGDRRLNWYWRSPDMPSELNAHKEIKPPTPQRQAGQSVERIVA
jgi:hypothetical protein